MENMANNYVRLSGMVSQILSKKRFKLQINADKVTVAVCAENSAEAIKEGQNLTVIGNICSMNRQLAIQADEIKIASV
jgi:hypothetical protein